MKKENKEKIFKILEPIVEFLEEIGVECKTSIFKSNYGAITYKSINEEQKQKLYEKLNDDECSIFSWEELHGTKYILFSFTIDGKWSHAWE